jgi:hypothetical protein
VKVVAMDELDDDAEYGVATESLRVLAGLTSALFEMREATGMLADLLR